MIQNKHLQEWQNSAVDEDLIIRCVKSLSGTQAYDYLFYSERVDRLNTGRLSSKWLNGYRHIEHGGWWCNGLDPLNNWEPMEWGCFKPDAPKIDHQKQKLRKYDHPPRTEARAFFLPVNFLQSWNIVRNSDDEQSQQAWLQRFCKAVESYTEKSSTQDRTQFSGYSENHSDCEGSGCSDTNQSIQAECTRKLQEACQRGEYREVSRSLQAVWDRSRTNKTQPASVHRGGVEGLVLVEDEGFWDSAVNSSIDCTLTEGAKKAASLLSIGYAAIGLPGVWMGRRKVNGQETLIPELALFTQKPRKFYFCFDNDPKLSTAKTVNAAIACTGELLIKEGCQVKVITWDAPEKGVDDFIVAHGAEVFKNCYDNALSLKQWMWVRRKTLTTIQDPDLIINTPDLSTIALALPEKGIIGIESGKGTGKTKLIAMATSGTESLLSLTHLIFLGRTLSERLGYTYRTDADRAMGAYLDKSGLPTMRLGTCVHSLLAFNPEKFVGCDLVWDEVCQGAMELLAGKLCNEDGKRPALLARFEWLVKVANRIIVADADLDQKTINYIQQLRGEKAYIIRNTYKPKGYKCLLLKGKSDAATVAEIVKLASEGQKLFITTDSKKVSKLVSELVSGGIESSDVIVINSDNSGCVEQRELIGDVNNQIKNYRIVITSPSMATGVSIEVDHFDYVIGIFHGVLSDASIAQALMRVRPNIPRIVWVANQGNQFSRVSNSDNAVAVKMALKTRWDREVALIRSSLNPDIIPFIDAPVAWDDCPHKTLWAHYTAESNFSMWNLYDNVAARLRHEGHEVELAKTEEQTPEWLEQVKELKLDIELRRCKAVANAPVLDQAAIQQIKAKENATPEERLAVEKAAIASFAVTDEVTPELVEEFPDLVRGVSKLEDLQHGLAVERDQRAIEKQAKWGFGLHIPDMPTREQERVIREKLGLMPLIEQLLQGKVFTNEDLEQLGSMVKIHYKQINEVLKLGVSPKSSNWSNIRIFNALVKQLAIPVLSERKGKGKVATTQLDIEQWELVQGILKRREEQRQQQLLEQSHAAVDEVIIRGGDNGAYINKQCPLSPPITEAGVTVEAVQVEVHEAAKLLMDCQDPEMFKVIAGVMQATAKHFASGFKRKVWELLPQWKRSELHQWKGAIA